MRHTKKRDCGIGQVQTDSIDGTVRIFLTHAGEKTIPLDFVQPEKLSGDAASSPVLDQPTRMETQSRDVKGEVLYANGGAPTQFGETANPALY